MALLIVDEGDAAGSGSTGAATLPARLPFPLGGTQTLPPLDAGEITDRLLLPPRQRVWTWTLVNGTDELEISPLTKGRRLSWPLDGPPSATFSLNGRTAAAASVVDMATDVVVYADGQAQFRGRVTSSQDDIDTDLHALTVNAVGYSGLLGRRELDDNDIIVYEQMDKFDIGWALITAIQAKPGGDLGIIRGTAGPTNQFTDRAFEPGQNVAELLDQMGNEFHGYDWEIDALRRWNLWTPRRGNQLDTPLDLGGTVAKASRQLTSTGFANVLRVAGDQSIDPVLRADPAIANSPFGRWEKTITYSNAKSDDVLAGYADVVAQQLSTLPVSYSLILRKGVWPSVDLMGPGDTARLVINSGRVAVDAYYRITQVDLELTEDGSESVTLTVIPPDWFDPTLVDT